MTRVFEHRLPNRLSACALALLLAGPMAGIPLATAQQTEAQQARDYDIPAGPLGQVLSRFAAEAGILLSGDAALTARAAAVSGCREQPDNGCAAPRNQRSVLKVNSTVCQSPVALGRLLQPFR